TMPAGTTNLGVAPAAHAARTVLVPRRLSGDHAMLRLLGNSRWLCRGATRRDLLHIGGLGAFGFVLADDLGLRAEARPTGQGPAFGRARSCILLYKYGSPAQHETFDPKPGAPAEVQGELGAIPTSVPGVRISDHLPRIARIMDRLTVVRSLTHPYPLHATVYATTGIPEADTKIEPIPRPPRQWPFIGSVVDYLADREEGGAVPAMPRNIALPFVMGSKNEYPPLAGPYGAMLGMRYDPVYTEFHAEGTTRAPEIRPGQSYMDPLLAIRPTDRLQLAGPTVAQKEVPGFDLRRSLLDQFNTARRDLDAFERITTFDQQQDQAFSLLTSSRMHDALDYTRESTSVRDAYGMSLFGQSCLAARRLVE